MTDESRRLIKEAVLSFVVFVLLGLFFGAMHVIEIALGDFRLKDLF